MLTKALSRRRPAALLAVSGIAALVLFLLMSGRAYAQEQAVGDELQFILNTFSFLIWGALVMWMCAGFTMLESGSVRTKNASMICLRTSASTRSPGWRTSSSATTSCTSTSSAA